MVRANITKQHILDEIRRTAKENKGVPLGVARFFQETGIKDADWAGRFWARWGDALQEAGFAPNQFNAAYEEGFLLARFASLIQELGKFPVRQELKLKARSDESFPSPNVFARIGKKHELAKKVYEFCKGNLALEDVLPICETAMAASPDGIMEKEAEGGLGYVYLMKSGRFYKLGRSNSAGRREYELAIQMPDKLTTIHTIRTDDPSGIEDYWHRRFADKRKNGEWFDLGNNDVLAFKRRKFM